jgi:hypothetical protein
MVEKSSLNFDLKRRRKNLWLFIVNENQSKDVHLPKNFLLDFKITGLLISNQAGYPFEGQNGFKEI